MPLYQICVLQSEANVSYPQEITFVLPLEKYLHRMWLNLLLQAANF